MKIANLYESRTGELAFGHIKGVWRDLGREVGTRTVGLRRIEIAEGCFSTPAHEHGVEEEIFFVLGGEGLLWQDGETYAVGEADFMVHRPKRGPHTLRAGAGGFLLKGGEPGELFSAIRLVAAGESLLAPSVTKRLIDAYTSPNPNNCRSPLPESPDRQDPRIPHPHEAPRARSRSASRDRLPSRPRLALEQRIRRIYRARRR